MGGAMAQIRPEGAPIQSSDLPLSTCNTFRSGEDTMEHTIELTDLAKEIASLKKRVTKLEQRQSSRILGLHPFRAGTSRRHSLCRRNVRKHGRKNLKSQPKFQDINDLVDEGINFILDEDADKIEEFNLDADIEVIVEDKGSGEKGGSIPETISTVMPDISATRPEVSTAEPRTPPTTTTLFNDKDVTIIDTLEELVHQIFTEDFDTDSLTNSMNYIPVSAENQTDKNAGPKDTNVNTDDKAEDDKPKDVTSLKTVVEPVNKEDQAYIDELDMLISQEKEASDAADSLSKEFEHGCMDQRGVAKAGSTNSFNTVNNPVNAAKAAKTMLADSLLPISFWVEAVNTACYVPNRVLVTKSHNKTPYELLTGIAPILSFMRPFSCPVTILNTLDHLGKFNGKANEGFLVSYSINSKAFRVYNSRTEKVKENLHVNFLENKPNIAGSGLERLFDINSLTNSMNYQPVSKRIRTDGIVGSKIHSDAGQEGKEKVSDQEYILLPVLNTSSDVPSRNEKVVSSPKDDAGNKSTVEPTCVEGAKINDLGFLDQQMKSTDDSENTNSFNTASLTVNTATALDDFSKISNLEDTSIFDDAYNDRDEGAQADYNNLETMKPKKVTRALDDESWVEAMQEELL
nr:retrovirus-related Pol polyprotein from transposon TNT 1-94 [Tanacetum cinerariifolium]